MFHLRVVSVLTSSRCTDLNIILLRAVFVLTTFNIKMTYFNR